MEACKDGGVVETEPKWAELADVNPDYILFHFFCINLQAQLKLSLIVNDSTGQQR